MYKINHFLTNLGYLLTTLKRKPVFFVRLLRNYFIALARPDFPPLRFADIAVTYDCTMRCSHCSATDMKRPDKQVLSIADYEIIARKLIDAGLLVVNFTGGEPLLRNDLHEVIAAFMPHKLLVAVQTNASLVTKESLQKLRQAGVDSIGISIDGADPSVHDGFRNSPGAFEQALRTLESGKHAGFNMGISYCLTHENLHSADREQIVELSKKFGTLLNYNLASPIGFWKGNYDSLLTKEDRQFLNRLLQEYPRSKTDFETNYFKRGCGAMKEKIYVNAYGEVMPCPFIQVSFGNLLTDSIKEIMERAFRYQYFSTYWPSCLAAEDLDFIKNTRCYSKEFTGMALPVSHDEAFIDRERACKRVVKSQ